MGASRSASELQGQPRLLRPSTGDDLGGLDRTQLDDRSRTRGIAADQGLAETGIAFGDLLRSPGPQLGARKPVSEHGSLSLDGLLKTTQAKLSRLDVAVGDRATQAKAFRPLESLAQRSCPDLTFVQ
ncbi:MAG: hypothetical protein RJA37_1946 [Verrucomicrobiota bacterium]